MSEETREIDLSAMAGTDEAVRDMLHRFLTHIATALDYISVDLSDEASFTTFDRIAARSAAFTSVDQSQNKAWVFSEEAGNTGDLWNLMCETPNLIGDPDSEHPENIGPVQGTDSDGIDLYDAISIQPGTDPYGEGGSDAIFVTVVRRGQRMIQPEVTDFLTGKSTPTGPPELTPERPWYETIGWANLSALDVNVSDAGQFIQRLRQCLGQYRRSHPIQRVFDSGEVAQAREDRRAAAWGKARKTNA